MALETYKYWTTGKEGRREQRTAFRASKADKAKERARMQAKGARYVEEPVNQTENKYSFKPSWSTDEP